MSAQEKKEEERRLDQVTIKSVTAGRTGEGRWRGDGGRHTGSILQLVTPYFSYKLISSDWGCAI